MSVVDYLRRQFTYDVWANQEVIKALKVVTADARSIELMAHILAAEQVWLDRLMQVPQSVPVWPKTDLPVVETHAASLATRWAEFLDGLADQSLGSTVHYK